MFDSDYMKLALKEAKKGMGRTSPNPAVGAVIVKDGVVVGRGYHQKAGTPHAEIHAINSAVTPLQGATIYVTLEPCSHTGKTPPCCVAIEKAGINRVVVGMRDPNPLVDGRGNKYLKDHGIEVESGVLEKECEELNRPFIKYIKTKMPYVVMKAGISLDGRLNYQSGVSGWITGDKTSRTVHQLRNQLDAIMVGSSTILIDNPSLTTRLPGENSRDPVRIILDTTLATPLHSKVYQNISDAAPMIFCADTACQEKRDAFEKIGVRVFTVKKNNDGLDLKEVLYRLGQEGILSVLVEGGGMLHGSFLREELYDFAYLFYGPRFAGDSGQALVRGFKVTSRNRAPSIFSPQYRTLGEDMLVSGKLLYPDKE